MPPHWPDAPRRGHGMPRLRHGDLDVLAVVLDTSASRLRRLAT